SSVSGVQTCALPIFRATALPIADDDTPSCRPASVKLRVSAAWTKAFSDPRLSIREPPLRIIESDMFGTAAHFSNPRESHLGSTVECRARRPQEEGHYDDDLQW